MRIQSKVFVVTGGGSGIGQQLVALLLDRGAAVAAVDINNQALLETRRVTGCADQRLSLHPTDIADRDAVRVLVDEVMAAHGQVDGVINNAGIIHRFESVMDLDDSTIDRVINVNLYGVLNMTRAFLPLLQNRPEAHIVNVSSMGGLFAFPNQTVYGASKAAVKLFSEGLYAELRGSAVGVTVVFPGAIRTNLTINCDAHSEKIDRVNRYYKGTSPQTVARRIIRSVENNRFRLHVGVDAKVLSLLYLLSPRLTILLVKRVMDLFMSD